MTGAEDAAHYDHAGAGLLIQTMPFAPHWSLGITPYSGNHWPLFGSTGDQTNEEYGVQVGAYWSLSQRITVSVEVPYALGRLPAAGFALDPTALVATAAIGEPSLAGMLTLSFQF